MQAAGVRELRQELNRRTPKELTELCLDLAKFKKENKELLTYLLFEAADEEAYVAGVKREVDEQFEQINRKSHYFIRKSVRKILRGVKRHIRYSKKKETEVELLIYFCRKLKDFRPSIQSSTRLMNIYRQQLSIARKALSSLDEDLQHDYGLELDKL